MAPTVRYGDNPDPCFTASVGLEMAHWYSFASDSRKVRSLVSAAFSPWFGPVAQGSRA